MDIVQNPYPILQQKKSIITTNPFIIDTQSSKSISLDKWNNIYIKNLSKINKINNKISSSVLEFLDELYEKPKDKNWIIYLTHCFNKKNRTIYFTLLFMYILIIILIIQIFI